MSVDHYLREVQRRQGDLGRLQHEKAREVGRAADETRKANAAAESAGRTNSLSIAQSKLRDAQRHSEAAARHQLRVADIESKIARENRHLMDTEKRLSDARQQLERQRVRDQERAAREHEIRMRSITGTLTQHGQLHQVALSAIEKLQQLPEEIVVLFLAANPLDQKQLRLDEEARTIHDMIRRSEHHDAVRFESRWAVRPLDVLQAINECQPRIVQFSGHGSDTDEIVFQDSSGNAKSVPKAAIVQTMAATSGDIQLVFFNTCFSRSQAEAVVQHVPAAIGMNRAIGDEAARVFSSQFYSAIGFGHSVGKAFQQAKAALMLESIPEESTPELFLAPGLSADQLVLVRPADGG